MGLLKNIVNAKVSGNVGSMNFRRRGSQTVVAERSYTNSSKGEGASEAQRMHRSRLANIVNFSRVIQAIQARAWQGKPDNRSDFNMLCKYNLAASPVFLTKQEAQARASVVAPYEVSRGTLPTLTQSFVTAGFNCGVNVSVGFNLANNTVGGLSQKIIANNNGWQHGDKLSVAILNHAYVTVAGVQVPWATVKYVEITIDVEDTTNIMDVPGMTDATPSVATDGSLIFGASCVGAFAVHSRKISGILETSSQSIIMKSPADAIYTKYTGEAQKNAAMASYGYQGDVLLTPADVDPNANFNQGGANVTSVTYDGQPFTPGSTLDNGKLLVIEGEGFTKFNISVEMQGVIFVPQVMTETKRQYTLGRGGTVTIYVNGQVYATALVANSDVAFTQFISNGTELEVPLSNTETGFHGDRDIILRGSNLGPITAVGLVVVSDSGDDTERVALISSPEGEYDFTLSSGGVVFWSGHMVR